MTSVPDTLGLVGATWTQRNWSRVGVTTDGDGTRWFLKQFIDANGRRLEGLFEAEQRTSEALSRHRFDVLVPAAPFAAHSGELVLAYPFHEDLVTLDVQAQAASATNRAVIAEALSGLVNDLRSYARFPQSHDEGSAYDAGHVAGWKGLDIKNLSLRPDGRLLAFDFGPMYRAPVADPVARLVASVLVANWGRPVRRLWAGPPPWSRDVLSGVLDLTTRSDVERRLARLLVQRLDQPQRDGVLERALVCPATRVLAPRYWAACRSWTEQHLATSTQPAMESPSW